MTAKLLQCKADVNAKTEHDVSRDRLLSDRHNLQDPADQRAVYKHVFNKSSQAARKVVLEQTSNSATITCVVLLCVEK